MGTTVAWRGRAKEGFEMNERETMRKIDNAPEKKHAGIIKEYEKEKAKIEPKG